MSVSAERLAAVDGELAELGRSEDQIESVLVRFEDREPEDLAAVDAELEQLAADVGSMDEILARARDRAADDARDRRAAEEKRPRAKRSAKRGARGAEPHAEEPAAVYEPVAGYAEEPAGATLETPPPLSREGSRRLSVDDLFGEEMGLGPDDDLSSMFGGQDATPPADGDAAPLGEVGLADSLEVELEGLAAPAGDAEEEDSTGVFSANDIAAIEGDQAETARESAHDAEPQVPRRIPSSRPPRPSQFPHRDPAFDALLGDDESIFRPSQHPPAGAPLAAGDAAADDDVGDEFELLVDDDILVVEDDEGETVAQAAAQPKSEPAPWPAPTASSHAIRPPPGGDPQPLPAPEPAPEPEEGAPSSGRKSFFKKLFGGGD